MSFPLPSVSLVFEYKPAAAAQPDSATSLNVVTPLWAPGMPTVIWEHMHNYIITVMFAIKRRSKLLLFSAFWWGWGPVTFSFFFSNLSSSLCVKPTPRYSEAWSKHVCWRHTDYLWADVCVRTRAISEGQMGPSQQHDGLVAQSTMAPVQTSRTTTSNRTPVCLCARLCLCLIQLSHARHIWWYTGSRGQYVISENTLSCLYDLLLGKKEEDGHRCD